MSTPDYPLLTVPGYELYQLAHLTTFVVDALARHRRAAEARDQPDLRATAAVETPTDAADRGPTQVNASLGGFPAAAAALPSPGATPLPSRAARGGGGGGRGGGGGGGGVREGRGIGGGGDDPAAKMSTYPGTLRQLAVAGLGHDEPTLLISNRDALPAKQVIETYSRRMNIEQRLAEAIRSFGLDALAGAVPLNVDLDVVLCVLAHTLCAALRRRLPGYATATPDTLQRRFLTTGGHVLARRNQLVVRLDRHTYSPVLRQADLPQTLTIPWLRRRTLRYEYA